MADPAPQEQPRPIIVKRIKKGGHEAHHGGAWKVAYADFVTAMMAFFLLMWLLNATSDEQKMGISNYFDPIGVSQGATGAGGVLGGLSVKSEGVLQDVTASPTLGPPLGSEGQSTDQGPGASSGDFASGEGFGEEEDGEPSSKPIESDTPADEEYTEEQIEEMREKIEQFEAKQLERTEEKIKQAIEEVPELKEFSEHLLVEQTPDGLRIQILDQAKKSMFPLGSSRMYSYTKKIIENVAHVVASLPNRIAVTGHTDAKQYTQRSSYTNWELSTDRANASRRVLLESGIPISRIFSVVGKADTELLKKDQPYSPLNRRISITLLKKSITRNKGNDVVDTEKGPAPNSLAAELAYYEEQERKAAEIEKNGPPPPEPVDHEKEKYEKAVEIPIR